MGFIAGTQSMNKHLEGTWQEFEALDQRYDRIFLSLAHSPTGYSLKQGDDSKPHYGRYQTKQWNISR